VLTKITVDERRSLVFIDAVN